jgi:hypothetical protein
MITTLFIVTALVLLLGAFYYFFKGPQNISHSQNRGRASSQLPSAAQTSVEPLPGILDEETWWNKIGVEDKLDLAIQLARKALPIWEKFTAANGMVYRSTGAGPYLTIDHNLLFNVLQDIQTVYYSQETNRIKLLHQYYDSFLGPVIAMHDGDWPANYPVKKIFLAVYNIVKSTLEQSNPGNTKSLLSVSINQSLDCLDISGVYSKPEILEFLAAYKKKLQINTH